MMKPFIATVVVGCSLALSLAYRGSVGQRLDARDVYPASPLKTGQTWLVGTSFLDDRLWKSHEIETRPKADIVAFGSSRIWRVNSNDFRPDFKFFNAGVSATGKNTYIGYWQNLKDSSKIPRFALLFADPWILQKGVQFRFGEDSSERYYEEFLASQRLGASRLLWSSSITRHFHRVVDAVAEVRDLFTWETVVYTFRQRRWRDDAKTAIVLESDHVPLGRCGYRSDGSRVETLPSKSVGELREDAIKSLTKDPRLGFSPWHPDPEAIEVLTRFVEDLDRHQVHVMIVIPPYGFKAHDLFLLGEKYKGGVSDYLDSIESLGKISPNVSVCDAFDPKGDGCGESEFYDWMHMRDSCTAKVLQRCFSQSPAWAFVLPNPGDSKR